jgi:hypothetical protein
VSDSGRSLTERTLGFGFGIAGAVLVAISALVRFVGGFVDVAMGHATSAADAWGGAFVFLVLAAVGAPARTRPASSWSSCRW